MARVLASKLVLLDLPQRSTDVRGPDDLLLALVHGADNKGRYWADGMMLKRLFWWQWEKVSASRVEAWRDALVERGDAAITRNGYSVFDTEPFDVITVLKRRRFQRWAERQPIPDDVRQAVYLRDGFRCLHCGSPEGLSLDHIYPWSLGGSDDETNLQTLCRPCNSRKGAKI